MRRTFAPLLTSWLWLLGCELPVATVSETGRAAEEPPAAPLPGAPQNRAPQISSFRCDPGEGPAPLRTTCSWQASDPEGEAIRCGLDFTGEGAMDHELADCAATTSQAHELGEAGARRVTLRVVDARGSAATAHFDLAVSERPNLAPVIDSFSADPATGPAPLSTSFGWSLSDPDGDALVCRLDVGGDGTVEHELSPCTSATRQAHGFSAAGQFRVVLTVLDGRGASSRRELTVTARPPPVGDVRPARAEWAQSVVSQTLRLVEGKPALLRVYVLADRSGLANVTARAEGFLGGTSVGTVNLSGPVSPPTAENPADLSQSYRGTIPDTWIAPGLEVRVTVDPADQLSETDEANNALVLRPSVGSPTVLQLTAVPVVFGGVTATIPATVESTLLRIWPLKGVNLQTRAPYTYSGTLSANDANGWSRLLQEIASVRTADGSRRYYFGFVRVGYGSGIAGIGYLGQPSATGRVDSLSTLAHELGHNMNRPHAPCGNPASPDPSYPYPNAQLGSYGFDLGTQRLIAPAANYDLMSYCTPEWVSDYNYSRVQSFLETNPPQANILPPQPDMLLVSGRRSGQTFEVRPPVRLTAAPSEVRDGPFVLRLTGSERVVSVPFDLDVVEDLDGEAHFHLVVQSPGELRRLEVLHGDQVLYAAGAEPWGAAAPRVELSRTADGVLVRWDAAAWPQLSAGHLTDEQRTTLGLWQQGGEALLRTEGLPEGGRLELSLSRGLSTQRLSLPW